MDDSLRTSIDTPFKISIDRAVAASIDASSRMLYGQVLSQAMACSQLILRSKFKG
ncbi:hypothetical protein F2Q68_00038656 [Brassica cretica]|uniref:Uncharacterized protein n=1 Tax=Brassica cretica TaxID=69181 RepID=A0A8S9MJD9_BRACR|nr:hypothetical protein F2Q68_00038656 [Brassica cretica]